MYEYKVYFFIVTSAIDVVIDASNASKRSDTFLCSIILKKDLTCALYRIGDTSFILTLLSTGVGILFLHAPFQ